MTKDEKLEYKRKYYQEHKEELKIKQKEYRDKNREKIREKAREYNRLNADKIKQYELAHIEQRKEIDKRQYQKRKFDRQKNKAKAIIYKGGKCEKCDIEYNGTNGCIFDFHHIDPSLKDYSVSIILYNRTFSDKIKKELDKCILLCSNCHRLIHNKEY